MPRGVYPHPTADQRLWAKTDSSRGPYACWPCEGFRITGEYVHFWFHGRPVVAHRVAWILTFGLIPPKLQVCHACDNPPCVNPAHLFLGTQLDNMRDKVAKGRQASGLRNGSYTHPERRRRGVEHGQAQLTESQVYEIRRRAEAGALHRVLAADFHVSKGNISYIVRGETWQHLLPRQID